MQTRVVDWLVMSAVLLAVTASARAADTPSVKLALQFRPVQKGVQIETPNAAEFPQCRVKVERQGKTSGWLVLGAGGQTLRRYVDTNADNVVDQWRYFNNGLEVYRDVDSNFNNKVDQSRWLNAGGTRWGMDTNEDGHIDRWKVLSAEEATQIAVEAMIAGDSAAVRTVLINADDIRELGISKSLSDKLLTSVGDFDSKVRTAMMRSRVVNRQTKWMRFDAAKPSIIPVDSGKAGDDLMVYENVMSIVETSGQPGFVQIGEMVRVGNVWKLTQVPAPLESNSIPVTEGGILMQPSFANPDAGTATAGAMSPEAQKLLEQLQTLDRAAPAPNAGGTALARYSAQRMQILNQLVSISKTEEERGQWMRQMIDGLASSVQTGQSTEGLKQLQSIENDVRRRSPSSPLVAYAVYRRLLAQYSVDMQRADTSRQQEVQELWFQQLEKFVTTYPTAKDTPEAMLQLAIAQEFGGKTADARQWYSRLASGHADSTAGKRAAGALRRIDLKGKAFVLSGPGMSGGTLDVSRLRGRVVLVYYWATWCKPCTEDLPQIRAMYEQYHDRGFEIVGVNLDSTIDPVRPYLTRYRVGWPQIFEPGGLASPPAQAYGIISLPTMILIDSRGKVLSRNTSVAELKVSLPQLLKQ